MPAAEMKFDDVVLGVAKELTTKERIAELLGSPEGRSFLAGLINTAVDDVKAKLGSEIAEERKLRTGAEEAAADLMKRFEKFERQMTYDREFGFHRGLDGSIQPSVSRDGADKLITLVRALRDKDIEKIRAVSTGTNSEGGYLVPTEVASEVLRLIPTTGLYPQIARPWPMGAQKVNIGAVLSQMQAYWPNENSPITESFPTFSKTSIEAKLLAALIPVPLTLIEDSNPDVGQLIADLIRECISLEIDRVGIAGKTAAHGGTDVFDGLLYADSVVAKVLPAGQTHVSDITGDDLLDLQTAVPDGARDGCSYLLSPTLFDAIRKTKSSTGEYVKAHFITDPTGNQPGTIWGRPYFLTERLPAYSTSVQASKRTVSYGNFKKWAIYGTRRELAIATSDVAGDAFKNVQLIIRGITRVGLTSFGPALAELETAAA